MTKDNKTNAPIVVLNSGGFDSVVLLHNLRDKYPDRLIYSLFFNYGQNSVRLEYNCVKKVCKKLNSDLITMTIPRFSWTKSNFYGDDFRSIETQCLEWRNFVFISYAMSLCESLGAKEIYLALINNSNYKDNSKKFIKNLNNIGSASGIKIKCPFHKWNKLQLIYMASLYNITEKDFHSCDTPVNGKPCGSCPDCRAIKVIMEEKKTFDSILQK